MPTACAAVATKFHPQQAAPHDRRVDLPELVDGVVRDVVALGDELDD
jgi:hypothetical protein